MNSFSVLSGRKRRRVGDAGKNLKYVEVDSLLLAWYRERQTKVYPSCTTSSTDIRREIISISVKHQPPSTKWYYRLMKRHRLSLQRPKRQQKIQLTDAHKLATSFYRTYDELVDGAL